MEKFVNPITEEEQAILTAPVSPNDIQILPSGALYIPHDIYRQRVVKALGIGAIQPDKDYKYYEKGNEVCFESAAYIKGKLIDVVVGGCDNPNMSYSEKCETAKTNWLKRVIKGLAGGFLEVPTGKLKTGWLSKYAIQVILRNKKKNGKTEYVWRRYDDTPFSELLWYYRDGGETIVTDCELNQTNPEARISESKRGELITAAAQAGISNEEASRIVKTYNYSNLTEIKNKDFPSILEHIQDGIPSVETLSTNPKLNETLKAAQNDRKKPPASLEDLAKTATKKPLAQPN